jgi:hypothetical protein
MNAQKIGVAGLALLLGTAACNLQRESSAYSTGPVTTRTVRVLRREFREGDAFTRAGKVRKFNWRGDAYPDDYNVTLAVDDRTNYVLDTSTAASSCLRWSRIS